MSEPRRLLLVTYYYPPLGGPGVFRPLRLSKYLPRRGWQVSVLTVDPRVRALRDLSLAGDVPDDTRIERTATLEPRTLLLALSRIGLRGLVDRIGPWLMLPDEQRGWVPFARRRGLKLLAELGHDAVVSTAGPYSTHLVAQGLKRETGIPWVADFRDEWTTNPYLRDRYPTEWHRSRNRAMERGVLESADRVTCVSGPWLDALRSNAPGLGDERCAVMPNGFDAEHFGRQKPPLPDRFRIVYTGMFYGHRTPTTFFDGLARALEVGAVDAASTEVVFMGHGGPGWSAGQRLDRFPDDMVRIVPQRPYLEALRLMDEAAVLLLVVPRQGGPGNHTGKLFPYLASGRPVLALAPSPNVAGDLVTSTGSGRVVDPDDVDGVATALAHLYAAWKRREEPAQDRSAVLRYEAANQADEWARLLDELVKDASRSSTSATTRPDTTSSE